MKRHEETENKEFE